jgi:hypothetical protein
MKKASMVCAACIKRNASQCHLGPDAVHIGSPDTHWCAQGVWHQWSERYQEMEPFYWGEWDDPV